MCGLGQSELIQTRLFLPKIHSQHRQGKGGRRPPTPPTYRLAHAVEAWRAGGQGRWWERKRKREQKERKTKPKNHTTQSARQCRGRNQGSVHHRLQPDPRSQLGSPSPVHAETQAWTIVMPGRRRLPAFPPGPTAPPAQGSPLGWASHGASRCHTEPWQAGSSVPPPPPSGTAHRHRHPQALVRAPAAHLQEPAAPVPSICHLARAPEPPTARHGAPHSAFPPSQHQKKLGSPSQHCPSCSSSTRGDHGCSSTIQLHLPLPPTKCPCRWQPQAGWHCHPQGSPPGWDRL